MGRFSRVASIVTMLCFVWGMVLPVSGHPREEHRASAQMADSDKDSAANDLNASDPEVKEGPGVKKAAKKFPWLLVGAGAVAIVTAILLLTAKKKNPDNGNNNNGNIEYGAVTDIDGNVYRTVRIGSQEWMAENLRSTHYSDGTPIESFVYDNNEANQGVYGRMYRWTATMRLPAETDSIPNRVQGASPAGWHIPTEAEWQVLINSMGGESLAGGKLKESGTDHWASPNTGATNETGFSAVPSGYRGFGSVGFYNMGTRCLMAVAIGYSGWPTARELKSSSAAIIGAGMHPDDAIAVRCVRD
jgi:uncharacterized protein (TIGR02145 family)